MPTPMISPELIHLLSLVCCGAAGLAYCGAALRRWVGLAQSEGTSVRGAWLPGAAFACLTAALILALLEGGTHDFAYAVLGVWAATAGLHFALGFLTAPTRVLLVLPVGCLAILLAMSGLARPGSASTGSSQAVVILHSVLMASHLAVALVAGAAGGLFLIASRQLKSASARAFRLPPLPVLERIAERGLVIATALLMAGLALGGAAMESSARISLGHPSVVIALVNLLLLVGLFAMRIAGRIGRRGMAMAAVQTMVLAGLSAVGLQVISHGA